MLMVLGNFLTGDKMFKIRFVIVLLYLFFIAKCSFASVVFDDGTKFDFEKTENYFSVEFDQAKLSDILFFVAEQTGRPFVLNTSDIKLSWVQTNIFRGELYREFINILVSSGLIVQQSGYNSKITVISDTPNALSSVSNSVAYYRLKHIEADSLRETSEILYKERLAINPLENSKVAFLAGDSDDVEQFIGLIQAADVPKESDIEVYRLKNISVKTARVALIEMGVFPDNSIHADYWNRSIIVRGDDYLQNSARIILNSLDVPYEGITDSMQFVTTITPEAAIEVLSTVCDGVNVLKVADDRVLITGYSDKVEKAVVTLNKIDGAGLQVKVEAVITYLTDKEYKDIGIRMNYASGDKYFSITDQFAGGLLAEVIEDFLSIDIAAENKVSKGEIISSPSLSVLNGRQARLHVGQNVPYLSEANIDKNNGETTGTSISREDVGVSFDITPIIDPAGEFVNITLQQVISSVAPESNVENESVDIVLDVQELGTTVKIPNGGTVFLGGLTVDQNGKYKEKVPLLGDIPLVGDLLFSYTADNYEKRNLAVFLRVNITGG